MNTIQFQKSTKKLLPYAFLIGLLLLFTYGISITGNDLSFSAQLGEGGFSRWIALSKTSGGNYLSVFLSSMLVDVPILRHIFIAFALGATLITLISLCGLERPYMYFLVLFLGIASPAGIFSYIFGTASEAGTMLIPGFLMGMYLFTVSDLYLYKGQKRGWKIPLLFLNGILSQFFSEGISVIFLVLSLVFLFAVSRKYRFSWHLVAHFIGCLLGFIFGLLIPGAVDSTADSFYVIMDQLTLALDQLFVQNLLVLSLLTLGCLMLIQPVRDERSKNCKITLYLLLIPMALFGMLNIWGKGWKPFLEFYRILTVLKLVAGILYSIGVLRTLQHYVSKNKIYIPIRICLVAVWVCILVFSGVGTSSPAMLYIPYLLLVATTVLLLKYALYRYSRLEKTIRKPLFIACTLGVVALSFVTYSNGTYCTIRDTHIRECIAEETLQIVLPVAPYDNRLGPTTESQLSEYYDFSSYGNVEVSYVPYGQWDWNAYYEAHNIPVVEKNDDDIPYTEDLIDIFEEDE